MDQHTWMRSTFGGVVLIGTVLCGAPGAAGQVAPDAERAYYEAVASYFSVSEEEVAILSEWDLPPEEVPVVLFVAHRAGVSPDIVVAQRQRGSSWGDVAGRYRMGAGAFYVAFNNGMSGSLARAYGAFQETPRGEWGAIALNDREIVSLVNLRVLSQDLALAPARVLEARDRTGDFLTGYRDLTRKR